MGLVRTVAPTVNPVTRAEASAWCKVPADITADNDLIDALVLSAVDRCERVAGRSLITQTWRLTLDSFTDAEAQRAGLLWWDVGKGWWVIELPRPPLIAVSSLAYVDTAGDSQTLGSTLYQVDAEHEPGRVMPAHGQVWPSTRSQTRNAVTITWTAGYGAAASSVPAEIKDRLRAYIAYCYEHREGPDEDLLDRLFRHFWYGG